MNYYDNYNDNFSYQTDKIQTYQLTEKPVEKCCGESVYDDKCKRKSMYRKLVHILLFLSIFAIIYIVFFEEKRYSSEYLYF